MKRIYAISFYALAGVAASAQGLVYDNTVTYLNAFTTGGGATSGASGTNLLADDLTMLPSAAGATLARVDWRVYNNDAGPVTARMRTRFYADNAGTMGTLLLAVTFGATALPVGLSGWFFDFSAFPTVLPSNKMWASIVFDDPTNVTTAAQLNNLGMGVYNPPAVGSSADTIAVGNVAGVQGTNPNVRYANFGGQPPANLGWAVNVVPEPASLLAIGAGLAALAARRRRK